MKLHRYEKYVFCDVIAHKDIETYFVQQCHVVILVILGECLCVMCDNGQGTRGSSSVLYQFPCYSQSLSSYGVVIQEVT
jgi:hypothetical protein